MSKEGPERRNGRKDIIKCPRPRIKCYEKKDISEKMTDENIIDVHFKIGSVPSA